MKKPKITTVSRLLDHHNQIIWTAFVREWFCPKLFDIDIYTVDHYICDHCIHCSKEWKHVDHVNNLTHSSRILEAD